MIVELLLVACLHNAPIATEQILCEETGQWHRALNRDVLPVIPEQGAQG